MKQKGYPSLSEMQLTPTPVTDEEKATTTRSSTIQRRGIGNNTSRQSTNTRMRNAYIQRLRQSQQ